MSPAPLNPASVSALLSAVVSAIAAACAYLLGRVPDWDDVRPLTWVALTAAAASACNVTATLEVPPAVYLWTGRLQVAAFALHVLAWHLYLPGWGRRGMDSSHRLALWVLAGVAALTLWPGAVYADAVRLRPLPWLGVVYHDPALTSAGVTLLGLIGAYGLWALGMVMHLGRLGAPFPRAHLACALSIAVMALHDTLVVDGLPLPTPYLLDFAFYGPITLLGLVTLRRVGQSATDLRHLNAGLAGLVARRSGELERSEVARASAERLATLGQFAAGMAHEVNNPAAVVAANLDYLATALRDDLRDDVRAALGDARGGLVRIAALSRQLLVAGRAATPAAAPLAPVQAAAAVQAALAAARARCGPQVTVAVLVPPALHLMAHQDSLVQVLSHLLVNAAGAIPPDRDGTISVRAEDAGDRIRLVVEDDGAGLGPEALAHAFEPFHPSRPASLGTGLGLAVSRSLVGAMQGDLRLESVPEGGTRAILELGPARAPAAGEAGAPAGDPAEPGRARILIVDGDPQVRASMARLLGRAHDVTLADGVGPGIAALQVGRFDLVLCDVAMPGGGGMRLWAELPLRAPDAMARVAFMTGGAASAEARAFLAAQPQPVLAKPFDVSAVRDVLRELGSRGRGQLRSVGRVRPP